MGSIAKIHEMLVGRQASCVELTKSYLNEIEKVNGELNAYVCVTGDEALRTAEAVDKKIAAGEEIGLLVCQQKDIQHRLRVFRRSVAEHALPAVL